MNLENLTNGIRGNLFRRRHLHKNIRVKKRYKFLAGLLCIIIFAFILIQAMPVIYKNNIEKVKKRILKNNEDVELVEVLYDHGIYTLDLELDIYFYDGRRILLERVNKRGGGNIRISRIGPYGIRGYIRLLRRTYAIKTDILENELGINLNTVDDILRNYSSIYNFIDGFEDINSEKYDIYNKRDERWIWDGKLGLKTVLFNDEEICFFKRQWLEPANEANGPL